MLKRYIWNGIKPTLIEWLQTRALILPAVKQRDIAVKWKVDPALVQAINQEIASQAASAVNGYQP